MEPKQALQNLHQAARLARLTAEEHEVIEESMKTISNVLQNPKN